MKHPEQLYVGMFTPTRVTGITAAGRGNLSEPSGLLALIRSISPVCTGFSSSYSPLLPPGLSSLTTFHTYEMTSLSFLLF